MQSIKIEYKTAHSNDIIHVQELLNKCQLPYEDIFTSKVFLILALVNGQVVGCIGIEKKDSNGLLRSFAVHEKFRRLGVGNELLKRLVDDARKENIKALHLLTTTAERYFSKKGFVTSARNEAPQVIKNSTEFSTLCPSSSTYMSLEIV